MPKGIVPKGGFGSLDRLMDEMDQFWTGSFMNRFPLAFGEGYQTTQITETDNTYNIEVKLPGVKGEDVDVSYKEGVLNITAKGTYDKEDEGEKDGVTFHTRRFGSTSYNRSWQLPEGVTDDLLQATYKDGLLEVIVTKPEPVEPKTTKILIE